MAAAVRCPICGKKVSQADPNSPFCSDRCRIMDLSNWASEKYVISEPAPANELDGSDLDDPDDGPGR
ncbi:MAG: hypothetical protein JWP08_4214 [Bryobacterales bacterium]|jgi:uncharacterized protein|nr:hypothetical protein [Bryobacterales bacterium]